MLVAAHVVCHAEQRRTVRRRIKAGRAGQCRTAHRAHTTSAVQPQAARDPGVAMPGVSYESGPRSFDDLSGDRKVRLLPYCGCNRYACNREPARLLGVESRNPLGTCLCCHEGRHVEPPCTSGIRRAVCDLPRRHQPGRRGVRNQSHSCHGLLHRLPRGTSC